MSDHRETIIQNLKIRFAEILDPETANTVLDEVIKELSSYEISERCTAVAVYDDENERILKRYAACLRLDGKSEGTVYQYIRCCQKFFNFIHKPYNEVGVYDIRCFLALEKERGISSRSVENTRANLSAFFQWMTLEQIIQRNPCLNIKPIKYADEKEKPFFDTEIDALRSACKTQKERAIFEMLLSTGLRIAELVALDISDINTEAQTVHVRHGKGDKERITYATPVAIEHFKKYILNRKHLHTAAFLNNRGDRITDDGVRFVLNAIAKKANVQNVHPHRFRRTMASRLASRGMNIQEIQKLLGHTNLNTTMIYVTTDDASVQMSYRKYAV